MRLSSPEHSSPHACTGTSDTHKRAVAWPSGPKSGRAAAPRYRAAGTLVFWDRASISCCLADSEWIDSTARVKR